MEKKEKKNPLIGCFEISLFMKSGINNFDSNLKSMIRSFAIVMASFVITIITAPYIQVAKADLQDHSLGFVTTLFAIKFIVCFIAVLGFIYYFCKITHRRNNFIRYITVSNWCSLVPLVLFLPIFAAMLAGIKTYDDLYPATVLISLYTYALATFITRYVIDIPWELAVFLTVCVLAINEGGFSLLYYIAG